MDVVLIFIELAVCRESDTEQIHTEFKRIIINGDMCYEAKEKKNFL